MCCGRDCSTTSIGSCKCDLWQLSNRSQTGQFHSAIDGKMILACECCRARSNKTHTEDTPICLHFLYAVFHSRQIRWIVTITPISLNRHQWKRFSTPNHLWPQCWKECEQECEHTILAIWQVRIWRHVPWKAENRLSTQTSLCKAQPAWKSAYNRLHNSLRAHLTASVRSLIAQKKLPANGQMSS